MHIEHANISQINDIHSLISESITHLCKKDHLNDPDNLEFWLGNRTQDWLRETIFEPGSQGFVCLENSTIKGVSHIKNDGVLTLCYVHPSYPGKGIGTAVLSAVEDQASKWGLEEITLTGTATAKPFYESNGYRQYGDEVSYLKMPGFPMKKNIRQL